MVKSRVILDSNVWIGYFHQGDTLHRKAAELVHSLDTIYVPEYVLVETATILKMHASQQLAARALDVLLNLKNILIIPSEQVFEKSVVLFQSLEENHLSFIDISLLTLAKDYEVKTFDKKLASMIKKVYS